MEMLLVELLIAIGAAFGAFIYGTQVGEDKAAAKQATVEAVAQKAADKVATTAADAIAKLTPVSKTIYQKATHEVVTNKVYSDCINTDSMQRAINFALTGRPDPAGNSKLSGATTLNGPLLRSDQLGAGIGSNPVPAVPAVNRAH